MYYANVRHEEPTKLQGSIMLGAATRITVDNLLLTVTNPDRVWYLKAASFATAEAWGALLLEAIADVTSARACASASNEDPDKLPMNVRLEQLIGPGAGTFTLESVTAILLQEYCGAAVSRWTRLSEIVAEAIEYHQENSPDLAG
eukprot:UC1_evm1s1484